MLKQYKPAVSLMAVGVIVFSLAACERQPADADVKGPAERAGQQIDQAASRAGEELNKAAEKAGEGLQALGQKIQNEAEEAQNSQDAQDAQGAQKKE